MVLDRDSNLVFFSELILTLDQYKDAFGRVQKILDKHHINYRFLKDTNDIWCRDYMPFQKNADSFIQFRYEPSYLKDELELQSDPNLVLASNKIKANFSKINLDGGNVIKWADKVIMTRRIFSENRSIKKYLLIKKLEDLLEAEVLIIPDIKDDMTGHADGHLRFIDSDTLLVNQLDMEFKYWREDFLKMIKQSGLRYIEMPWFEHKDKFNEDTAIGSYVNFLEIGNMIIFPIFEVPGNLDTEAVETIQSVFPDRII